MTLQAPTVDPAQAQMQQATGGGLNPANFLIAAAQMHAEGSLASPKGDTTSPLPNKTPRRDKRIRIIK